MEQSEIISSIIDEKVLSIMKFFLVNDSGEFYLREIARLSKVSAASTYRILGKLVKLGFLEFREIKTAKLYSLKQGKAADFIKSMIEVDVVRQFTEKSSSLPGIEEILLLGKEKNKANLLVLGKDIDSNELRRLTAELKEKHNFTINYMSLTREQYEQMSAMGLYPGVKKSLWSRSD